MSDDKTPMSMVSRRSTSLRPRNSAVLSPRDKSEIIVNGQPVDRTSIPTIVGDMLPVDPAITGMIN